MKSVLLVDDDPIQIAILTSYFGRLNVHRIQNASNSAIGLEMLANDRDGIDLIVTDLQMPEMDGIEFLRHLKEQGYAGKLVIISSVKKDLLGHAARLAEMHNLDLLGQISKPLNKDALDAVFLKAATETPQGNKCAQTQLSMQEFSQALAGDEIVPFYQPKVCVQTGRVIGAEALARWQRADGRMVSPEVFISFAEENGLIKQLTFNLFQKALIDLRSFLRSDPNLKMAINIAPEMVSDVDLPDQLNQKMAAYGITSRNISFEVTENSILNLDLKTLEVLSRLRILEFEVAIDDFGTGSSNIQTLRDFPYSELKIDRSFISNATSNTFSRETVIAAVKLAKEQGMRIVAEGVEDLETWELLKTLGIEHAQGFLLAKALPRNDFLQFITDNQNGVATVAA